jgi:large subunit ribosomal protein L19
MKRLQTLASADKRTDLPPFRPGDTVRVHVRVVEGEKERTQIFEGIVVGIRGAGISRTFTVRKISGGIGVERVFPLHSPMIRSLEISRHGQVRRGKLFYLRDRIGKRARVRQRRPGQGGRASAVSDAAAAEPPAATDETGSPDNA